MDTQNIINQIDTMNFGGASQRRHKLELMALLFAGLVLLYKWLEQLYTNPNIYAYQSVFFWSTIAFFSLLIIATQCPQKNYPIEISALSISFATHIGTTLMGFTYALDMHDLQTDTLVTITKWNTLNYLLVFVIFKKLYRAIIAAIILYLIPLGIWGFFIYKYSFAELNITSIDFSTNVLTGAINIFVCSALTGVIYITNKSAILTQLAITDSLTGIANRLYLDNFLKSLSEDEVDTINSVALCDIDKFKRINDTYSHAVGDSVLQHFARILKTTLDTKNVVGRYGGEEFLIVFPNTTLEEAVSICERLRSTIESYDWTRISPQLQNVTASFGVSDNNMVDVNPVSHDNTTSDIMVRQADSKMYQAKNTGRNRVCF